MLFRIFSACGGLLSSNMPGLTVEGKFGVNGFDRIGKLTIWHHVGRNYFDELLINISRKTGTSLENIAHYAERDVSSSTPRCPATPPGNTIRGHLGAGGGKG